METVNITFLQRWPLPHLSDGNTMIFRFTHNVHLSSFSYTNFSEDLFDIESFTDYNDVHKLRWNY